MKKDTDDNVVMVEELYTYDAAARRYEEERHHEWLCRQKELKAIRAKQKARREYFIRQKIVGAFLVLLAVILAFLVDMAFLALVIPGIGIITTKKMVLYGRYYWDHGGTKQWDSEIYKK